MCSIWQQQQQLLLLLIDQSQSGQSDIDQSQSGQSDIDQSQSDQRDIDQSDQSQSDQSQSFREDHLGQVALVGTFEGFVLKSNFEALSDQRSSDYTSYESSWNGLSESVIIFA